MCTHLNASAQFRSAAVELDSCSEAAASMRALPWLHVALLQGDSFAHLPRLLELLLKVVPSLWLVEAVAGIVRADLEGLPAGLETLKVTSLHAGLCNNVPEIGSHI